MTSKIVNDEEMLNIRTKMFFYVRHIGDLQKVRPLRGKPIFCLNPFDELTVSGKKI
jgi:hypothetical protein